jgi:Acyl-CoA dehydrogenase, N-terminal domain.
VTAFALTSEQQDLAERVRDLASGQLRALAEAGTPGHVNRELIKAMGDLGLLARLFPGVAAGGLSREAAAMDLCLLREALATQSTEAETRWPCRASAPIPCCSPGGRRSFGAGCPRWPPGTRWRRSR